MAHKAPLNKCVLVLAVSYVESDVLDNSRSVLASAGSMFLHA